MPRPNWFFAFPVDGAFVEALPEVPASIRRFHREDVHLTLAFLGGCGEEAALRALAVLDRALAENPQPSLAISLAAVVPMGARPRYTALSALLAEGRAEATECLAELGGLLGEAALGRRPSRAPKPHVTLARPRPRASDAAREAGLVWSRALELGHVRQTLDRIALYTWSEVRSDRLFRIVVERSLAPSAGASRA